jgi:hypothetical protein
MRTTIVLLFFIITGLQSSVLQNPSTKRFAATEQEIIHLSKDK